MEIRSWRNTIAAVTTLILLGFLILAVLPVQYAAYVLGFRLDGSSYPTHSSGIAEPVHHSEYEETILAADDFGSAKKNNKLDVTNFITKPSSLPYNFTNYTPGNKKYVSQTGQDAFIDGVFENNANLFVLESGAFDGELISNSLFLETERRWQCLLVEANPQLRDHILSLHRKCYFLSGGLSISGKAETFDFMLAGVYGGFTETLQLRAKTRKSIQENVRTGKAEAHRTGQTVKVAAFPLQEIMKAIGKSTIDYWSLDTEGSELRILEAVDFDAIEVGVISIETQTDATSWRNLGDP